jgi:hypothetical protein
LTAPALSVLSTKQLQAFSSADIAALSTSQISDMSAGAQAWVENRRSAGMTSAPLDQERPRPLSGAGYLASS